MYIDRPEKTKGINEDLHFPKDDYFMSLAVLATTRSRLPNKVHNNNRHLNTESYITHLPTCLLIWS